MQTVYVSCIQYERSSSIKFNEFQVGLMRDGKIITENSPAFLLEKYQKTFLEEVFLEVCKSATTNVLKDDCLVRRKKDCFDQEESSNYSEEINQYSQLLSEKSGKPSVNSKSNMKNIRKKSLTLWFRQYE